MKTILALVCVLGICSASVGAEKSPTGMCKDETWGPLRIATERRPIAMRKVESKVLQRQTDMVKPPIGMRKDAFKGQ